MLGANRWRTNLRVVSPDGAVRVDLQRWPARRRSLEREVRRLPAGTPVVVLSSSPGALGLCRTFVERTGLDVERTFLALPSATAPGYLVEDHPVPARLFVGSLLAAPPRPILGTVGAAALGAARVLGPWPLLRILAPGRVLVGRRR